MSNSVLDGIVIGVTVGLILHYLIRKDITELTNVEK